jgi:dTDP-4-dehydrorhamnose reductase
MSQYKYKYEKYKTLYLELKSSHQNIIQNYNNITGGGPGDPENTVQGRVPRGVLIDDLSGRRPNLSGLLPDTYKSGTRTNLEPLPLLPTAPNLSDTRPKRRHRRVPDSKPLPEIKLLEYKDPEAGYKDKSKTPKSKTPIYVILTDGTNTVDKALIEDLIKAFNIILLHGKNSDYTNPKDDIERLFQNCKNYIEQIKGTVTDAKFFIVNSSADDLSKRLEDYMNAGDYENIDKHWGTVFTKELVEFAKGSDIPLIHYSTVYVNKGNAPSEDGWGIERINMSDIQKPKYTDAYGYVKALIENIILQYSKSFVLRLPEIIDDEPKNFETIEDLKKTPISNVIYELLTLEPKPKFFDHHQRLYPIKTNKLLRFIRDIIYVLIKAQSDKISGGVINLGGVNEITKYFVAHILINKYKLNIDCDGVKLIEDNILQSEKMIMRETNLPECLKGLTYNSYVECKSFDELLHEYKSLSDKPTKSLSSFISENKYKSNEVFCEEIIVLYKKVVDDLVLKLDARYKKTNK